MGFSIIDQPGAPQNGFIETVGTNVRRAIGPPFQPLDNLREVRLVEPLPDLQSDTIPFWIELFDHRNDVTIDSCGGDLEEAAVGAEFLIWQAKLLHRDSASVWLWRHGGKPCGWSRAWAWIRGECLFMRDHRGVLAR